MISNSNQHKDYVKDHQVDHILDSIKKVIKTGNYESDDDIIILTEVADGLNFTSVNDKNINQSNPPYKFSDDFSPKQKEISELNKVSLHNNFKNESESEDTSVNNVSQKSSKVSSEINLVRDFGKTIDQASTTKTLQNETIDSFLNKLMQPVISKWLSENLSSITEKVIQQHIEKLLSNKLK